MIKGINEYGKVEKCEEINGEYHVLITDGFTNKGMNTFKILELITKAVGDKYPTLKKCVSDVGIFDVILKP